MSIDFSSIDGFEWDKGNKEKNTLKHNVSCQEAEEVFQYEIIISLDEEHSYKETRWRCLGKTGLNRYLFLVFTIRNNKIRVISVRDMNKKEKKIYENS